MAQAELTLDQRASIWNGLFCCSRSIDDQVQLIWFKPRFVQRFTRGLCRHERGSFVCDPSAFAHAVTAFHPACGKSAHGFELRTWDDAFGQVTSQANNLQRQINLHSSPKNRSSGNKGSCTLRSP